MNQARMAQRGIGCWAIALVLTIASVGTAAEATFASAAGATLGDSFIAEVQAAWESIPVEVRGQLQRAGWRVVLAEYVVDAAPELLTQTPRGWPTGMSWRQTDAVHLPNERKLIIAEKRLTTRGEIVECSRCAGVLRHELGHGYDLAQGGRWRFASASPEFASVYDRDVATIPEGSRAALAYYLQAGSAGRQETFAEAFAVALGGGSDAPQAELFAKSFSRTLAMMHEKLKLIPPAASSGRIAGSRR